MEEALAHEHPHIKVAQRQGVVMQGLTQPVQLAQGVGTEPAFGSCGGGRPVVEGMRACMQDRCFSLGGAAYGWDIMSRAHQADRSMCAAPPRDSSTPSQRQQQVWLTCQSP